MLNYPYHVNEGERFFDAQKNLTDYCLSLLPPVKGKNVLEIGCGNGVQARYILENYSPSSIVAIDYVINIESAFHYPDKPSFFREIKRVLKPGGTYLVADILTTPRRRSIIGRYWKNRMSLNHWSIDNYEKELSKADLQIDRFSDITPGVIESFSNYRQWMRDIEKRHVIPVNAFILKVLLIAGI
ncbi:MAG: class I SAM-dependent methyltransferase [Bacteroidales bacterium]|nr:class I SAM-dependent methyltransferase [Bacteroidales bacterium]